MRRCAPRGRWIGDPCALVARGVLLAIVQGLLLGCGGAPDPDDAAAVTGSADHVNAPPVIESLELDPASPTAGGAVRVVASVRDPEGDPVKMVYEWTLRGLPVGNGTAKLMLTDARRDDALEVVVVASDGRADSEPASVRAQVGNRPPEVTSLRVGPARAVTAGEVITASAEGRDAEGDPVELVYTWFLNGSELDVSGPELDTRELTRGDVVRVEARADDGNDRSEPFVSPEIRVTNRPPKVVSRPAASPSGGAFRYAVEAEDPDGDAPLRFSLEEAPSGMTIAAHSGEIRWLPREGQSGRHRVRVVVDDMAGGRASHTFDVDVGAAVAPPAAGER